MDNDARPATQRDRGPHNPRAVSSPPSRRGFLVGGALGVVAAGAGVAVGLARSEDSGTGEDPASPQHLLAAMAAERALIHSIDNVAAPRSDRELLRHLRTDHLAHLKALSTAAALTGGGDPASSPGASEPARGGSDAAPVSRARLRALERQAATRAANAALQLRGRNAVLLASIAACEATHAELLS